MKVSVIIPCYNVEKYIQRCLDSVLNQDYEDIEIICVDDGSTDSTKEIIEGFVSDARKEIKLICQQNAGAPAARNNGMEKAKGDYFQFLDADDVLDIRKISSQILLAEQNNQPDIIVGSYSRRNESDKVLLSKSYNEHYEKSSVFLHLMRTDLGITSSNLFHRRSFDKGLIWNVNLKSSQEYELMFHILKLSGRVVFDLEDNTFITERVSGSISKSNMSENWLRYTKLRIDIFHHISETGAELEKESATQILFDAIRILYSHKPALATEYYCQYIPKAFTPSVTKTTGSSYIKLFKLFGFTKSEKIRSFLSK